MKKLTDYLINNKIAFGSNPFNKAAYGIIISSANEIQTDEIIIICEAESLLYSIQNGLVVSQPVVIPEQPEKKKSK